MKLKSPSSCVQECLPLDVLLERARLSCLRQSDLADGVGLSKTTISRLVAGKSKARPITIRALEQYITAHERALVDHLVSLPHARERMRERLAEEA